MWSQSLNISSELEEKFCDFTEKTKDVKESMEKFQGTVCRSGKENVIVLLGGEGWSEAMRKKYILVVE